MVEDRRMTFVKRWFNHAEDATDPFDRFFSLWIALIVAAQLERTKMGIPRKKGDTDRKYVLDYFKHNSDKVLRVLDRNPPGSRPSGSQDSVEICQTSRLCQGIHRAQNKPPVCGAVQPKRRTAAMPAVQRLG